MYFQENDPEIHNYAMDLLLLTCYCVLNEGHPIIDTSMVRAAHQMETKSFQVVR